MANEGDPSYSRGIPLEQAHEIRRDKGILELKEHVRRLTRELEQVKGSERRSHDHQKLNVSPIDIACTPNDIQRTQVLQVS